MAKHGFLFASALILPLISSAHAQSAFPCDSFQMQPDGTLAVVKPVTLTNRSGGHVLINAGMNFSPGAKGVFGLNIYETDRQTCKR